jgi:hypothetical protein
MIKPITPLKHQLTPNLTSTIQNLSTSLQSIQPADNQNIKFITYLLLGTALTGISVYHYIKNQEKLE